MADDARTKALHKIASLKRLADHPNTPPHEAEAARSRIEALRAKHGITSTQTTSQTNRTTNQWTWTWFEETMRQRQQQDRTQAQRNETERLRREAQRRWEEANRFRHGDGRPMTEAERREAQRDPLGWAARQDGRTHAQKNSDMFGRHQHGCARPASYFTEGGTPRTRNQHVVGCTRCRTMLASGMASLIHGEWVCTETVPGPRKKKFD